MTRWESKSASQSPYAYVSCVYTLVCVYVENVYIYIYIHVYAHVHALSMHTHVCMPGCMFTQMCNLFEDRHQPLLYSWLKQQPPSILKVPRLANEGQLRTNLKVAQYGRCSWGTHETQDTRMNLLGSYFSEFPDAPSNFGAGKTVPHARRPYGYRVASGFKQAFRMRAYSTTGFCILPGNCYAHECWCILLRQQTYLHSYHFHKRT